MMLMFRHHKYTWIPRPGGSGRHIWELVGPNGAVEFTASMYQGTASCGLEFHHFEPGRFFSSAVPDHMDCRLTGGRCWHAGISMYATDTLWPLIAEYLRTNEHGVIFSILEQEYKDRFTPGWREQTDDDEED